MNTAEAKNDTPETEQKETAADGAEQFQKMIEQCGCGCGPMMAKMMAAMAGDKDAVDDKEPSKP